MKNKWRILKIVTTVIIFGFLLSFSLKRFHNAAMEKVSVRLINPETQEKVYFIDEKNVREFIKNYNKTGKVGDLDIPSLEKEVNHFPSVDSANVYLNLNGNLNVDIVQKVPAFRLNKNGNNFYVDYKGNEFPLSKAYTHDAMLVTGDVKREEYLKLGELVKKINEDEFCKKYFIGVVKEKNDYQLITNEGFYRVEIGDLDNIDFKVKGFKTFVEKYLVYQEPQKYDKISLKFSNQIVTTLNPNFKENDSIISKDREKLQNAPSIIKQKALAVASQKMINTTESDTSKNVNKPKQKTESEKPRKEDNKTNKTTDKKNKTDKKESKK